MNDTNVPAPLSNASKGEQVADDGAYEYIPANSFGENHVANAIEALSTDNPRTLGSEGSSVILAASYKEAIKEKNELREKVRDLERSLDVRRDELEEVKVKCGVYSERIKSELGNRQLRYLGITIGVALVSIGIGMANTQVDAIGIGIVVVGAILKLPTNNGHFPKLRSIAHIEQG